jgi:hypothetical protein
MSDVNEEKAELRLFNATKGYFGFSDDAERTLFCKKRLRRESRNIHKRYFSICNLKKQIEEQEKEPNFFDKNHMDRVKGILASKLTAWNDLVKERRLDEEIFDRLWKRLYQKCKLHDENMFVYLRDSSTELSCIVCARIDAEKEWAAQRDRIALETK